MVTVGFSKGSSQCNITQSGMQAVIKLTLWSIFLCSTLVQRHTAQLNAALGPSFKDPLQYKAYVNETAKLKLAGTLAQFHQKSEVLVESQLKLDSVKIY